MTKTTVVHVNSPEWAQAVKDGTAVYIGRAVPRKGFKASKWANPFKIDAHSDRPAQARYDAILAYNDWLKGQAELVAALPELREKTLGCWCKPERCHGDLLKRLADMQDDELKEWLTKVWPTGE